MTIIRVLLAAVGIGLAAYGLSLLLDLPPADLRSIGIWFTAGILAHDAVFAPLAAAAGLTARRAIPPRRWTPLAYATVATITLILVAVPVLGRSSTGNPTVLDRDYPLGLAIALAAVWLTALGATLAIWQRTSSRSRPNDQSHQ
ncbi:hypothetical protein IU487_27680 [Nocardia puris]|uniref:hypothetical protein n=1 Tax=Nocardia puris TaxID=208602 RepID=UPI001894BA73|nr:hypothetical protein [Nocardia puris]MBF6214788.1 hypothetical protein [Nocardia puris]